MSMTLTEIKNKVQELKDSLRQQEEWQERESRRFNLTKYFELQKELRIYKAKRDFFIEDKKWKGRND